ncbi:MAG TPA: hypothetical protein VM009_04285 [Terriglobales bacterium]|nr:hypothetical protein [Terriglobales bacterium]
MPIHPNARQCTYIKPDAFRCGGPAVDRSDFCHHHDGLIRRFEERKFRVPALDDQNSIQVALMDVINALLARTIDRADAYAVIYALQTARNNVRGLTLTPPSPDELTAKLEFARQQGHSDGFAAGYKKAKKEDEKRRAEQEHEEDGQESLASFLKRELGEWKEEQGQEAKGT